jgi:nucleotide-binding universal stress UspA family protein
MFKLKLRLKKFMEIEDIEVKPESIWGSNMSSSSSSEVSTDSESITKRLDKLPQKIIVPLDGSDFSFRAAEYAINLAKLTDGEIICVHAIGNLPYIEYMTPTAFTIPRYIEEAKKQTEEWFSQVKSKAAKQGIKVTSETIFDLPSVAESIINYASEQKADLIVIGTRGTSGLKRLVLGSVASAVVAHASCPVLVVR